MFAIPSVFGRIKSLFFASEEQKQEDETKSNGNASFASSTSTGTLSEGEQAIVSTIDYLYELCEDDPTISVFFERANLKRLKHHQFQLFKMLLHEDHDYQPRNLREIHRHLELEEYHFDAFMDHLRRALRERSKLPIPEIREFLSKVEMLRDQLLDMPGDEAYSDYLTEVVDRFYQLNTQDELIGHFFANIDLKKLKRHQNQFILMAMGKKTEYTGRTMASAHRHLNISHTHFDRLLDNLRQALDERKQFNKYFIDHFLSRVEKYRFVIVTHDE